MHQKSFFKLKFSHLKGFLFTKLKRSKDDRRIDSVRSDFALSCDHS